VGSSPACARRFSHAANAVPADLFSLQSEGELQVATDVLCVNSAGRSFYHQPAKVRTALSAPAVSSDHQ